MDWIHISERKPETHQSCIAWDRVMKQPAFVFWSRHGKFIGDGARNVLADWWMPKPEPPPNEQDATLQPVKSVVESLT